MRSTFFFFSFFFFPFFAPSSLLFLSRPRKYESARQTTMMVTADHPFPGFFLSSFSILLIYPFIAREGETIRFFFRIISVFAIVRFRSRHEIVGGFFGKIKNERTNCFSFDIFFFFVFARRLRATSYELRVAIEYRNTNTITILIPCMFSQAFTTKSSRG